MTLHRLSLALIVAAAATLPVAAAGPASAADPTFTADDPAFTADEVVLTCFPHAPAEVRYDDTWGAARSGGRGHKGTDILSPKGVPVLAVADGTVVGLENGSSSGYYVRLAHVGGWETYYMHLDNDSPGTDDGAGGEATAFAPGLSVGDEVHAGEHIGYVGDSGNAEWTTSHTHFELHIGGGAVNPYPYVADVERRVGELTDLVTAALTLDTAGLTAVRRGDLWDGVIGDPGVACLPDLTRLAVERATGEAGGDPDDAPDDEPAEVAGSTGALADRIVTPLLPLGGQ